MTQLRPAARELSPTLQDLAKLAPDLKALFRDLDPLIDAVEGGPARDRGLPRRPASAAGRTSTRRCASSTRPLLGLGQYKNELSAFFANTVGGHAGHDARRAPRACTTCAREPGQPREPRRLSAPDRHQPAEPVRVPGRVQEPGRRAAVLRDAPLRLRAVADARDPAAARPADRPAVAHPRRPGRQHPEVLLRDDGANGAVAAPACKQQAKFPFGGEVTQYPHVNAATGATARALARSAQARRRRRPRRARASHGLRQRPGASGAARRGRRRDRRPRSRARRPGRGVRGARRLHRRAPRGAALPPRPARLRARTTHPQRVRRPPRPAEPLLRPGASRATRRRASRASSTAR